MGKYRLTRSAENDLLTIAQYGYRTYGSQRAEAYRDSLIRQFEVLADAPMLHRERKRFEPPVRICAHQSHVIIYRIVDANVIEIVRVRHGREDWL